MSCPLAHTVISSIVCLFNFKWWNGILFSVYAPLVRKSFPPDVDMLGTKIEENNWTTFNQSYGILNSSPPATESSEEGDNSVYYCLPKVNLIDLIIIILIQIYIKYRAYDVDISIKIHVQHYRRFKFCLC